MKKTATFTLIALAALLFGTVAAHADDAATFKAKCAACHGQDGSGDTAMGKKQGLRDLRSPDVQKQTDPVLFEIIANGKDGKASHAFKNKGLDDAQIKGLVAHLRSIAKT